jgi:transposase-like protein
MMDFPLTELLDERICTLWRECPLPSLGVNCPHCISARHRLFHELEYSPAYRCRTCHGDDTRLTGTMFEKT